MTRLSLDDGREQKMSISSDILFHKTSTTHPLKEYIPPEWRTHQVLSTLVKKSSGQFIYAATVVTYVSSIRHQPTYRLEVVLGMQADFPLYLGSIVHLVLIKMGPDYVSEIDSQFYRLLANIASS